MVTIGTMIKCPHCGAQSQRRAYHGLIYFVCSACPASTHGFRYKRGAALAWVVFAGVKPLSSEAEPDGVAS
jgi:ribosomal protein L37AE/L43A